VVGTIRSVHSFVEDVDSMAGCRGKGPYLVGLCLVDVWVGNGVGIGGVVCTVFLRNPTASPSSPSFPLPSAPSSFSATPGLR